MESILENAPRLALDELSGRHMLHGCERLSVMMQGENEARNGFKFAFDGINYIAIEDPDDGYRSCCEDLVISEIPPRYTFPGELVLCDILTENSSGESMDILEVRNPETLEIIFEVGTANVDDYYPVFVCNYHPENLSINVINTDDVMQLLM